WDPGRSPRTSRRAGATRRRGRADPHRESSRASPAARPTRASPPARPPPRAVAGVAVCVPDAVNRARASAAAQLQVYALLPAYRGTLAREGVAGPEDLLATGSEGAVREQLARFDAAGVTDLRVSPLCEWPDDAERTRELLRSLCRAHARGPAGAA